MTGPAAGGPRTLVVVVIDTDGNARRRTWAVAGGGFLPRLQAAVGGLVDVVALTDHLDMWVHDEGLYRCQANPVATILAIAHGRTTQPYYGTAVFTGGADDHGATRSLHPRTAARLLTAAHQARADTAALAAAGTASARFAAVYR